ncbi:hypothetical protein N7492_007122 [Penicillium capsulatum]|uniref:Killer toxin Kp4 domain-containing protein n=1 Tax=Penicillium capsulatum TaxID=69766 RepID=A0A9W9I339_9EURO|nr:hypothetical protein N7492_007122 [Penicillium capsulatum]KAJ6116959.1 hypothetical protein N7512_006684 [Penicillium capsulatum]
MLSTTFWCLPLLIGTFASAFPSSSFSGGAVNFTDWSCSDGLSSMCSAHVVSGLRSHVDYCDNALDAMVNKTYYNTGKSNHAGMAYARHGTGCLVKLEKMSGDGDCELSGALAHEYFQALRKDPVKDKERCRICGWGEFEQIPHSDPASLDQTVQSDVVEFDGPSIKEYSGSQTKRVCRFKVDYTYEDETIPFFTDSDKENKTWPIIA